VNYKERYGQWAIIAGASEGTGAEFARLLAAGGMSCILIARRTGPLEALADELRASHGVEAITASIDMALPDASDRIIEVAGNREVGLVVFNAGSDFNGSQFLDLDIDGWMALVNRNVITTMKGCHHFGRAMKKRGRGGLLLVGSGAANKGYAYNAVYCATKAFEMNLSDGLWAELAPHGVEVLSLLLGVTDTPGLHRYFEALGTPMPAKMASAREVAELGLARLPHGPVCSVGYADDQVVGSGLSAAQRREEVKRSSAYIVEFMGKA